MSPLRRRNKIENIALFLLTQTKFLYRVPFPIRRLYDLFEQWEDLSRLGCIVRLADFTRYIRARGVRVDGKYVYGIVPRDHPQPAGYEDPIMCDEY